MREEKEITVEIDVSLNDLIKLLEDNNFKLIEKYDLNDIYMIHKDIHEEDPLSLLNKCILIRDIIEETEETKMLTYKYKEYNDKKEITTQSKIKVIIDYVDKTKLLFEKLDFKELIRIYDHLYVYANDTDEVVIQDVNNKHLYMEIEDECHHANKTYKSIDEMKEVITIYNIPIKNNDYFVKKAEIELKEVNK